MTVARSEIGRRYGLLEVMAHTRTAPCRGRPLGMRAAVCACACGNMTTVRVDYLRNGRVLSCGCLRRMPPAERPAALLRARWASTVEEALAAFATDPTYAIRMAKMAHTIRRLQAMGGARRSVN